MPGLWVTETVPGSGPPARRRMPGVGRS